MRRLVYAGKLEDYKQQLEKAEENLQKRLIRNEKLKEKLKEFISQIDYLDISNVNIDTITNEQIYQAKYSDRLNEYKKLSTQWYELSEEDKDKFYSHYMDVTTAFDNYVESVRKIPELEEKIKKAQERFDKQYNLEHTYTTEMPETFKKAQEFLAKKWTEWDIARREEMYTMYEQYRNGEIDGKDYYDKYGMGKGDKWEKTDEQFYQMELQEAKILIIDLFNRIKKITGEKIYSWTELHYDNGALNGIVEGENGKAKVESIFAGGYNIQRLHVRVLVHEIK